MPRDLSSLLTEDTLSGMAPLASTNDRKDEEPLSVDHDLEKEESDFIGELGQSNEKRDQLHPYTQTLSMSDVESCVRLEEAAFPPAVCCSCL